MDDEAKVEKFLTQCKSNDVDVKVDAIVKFQSECEAGLQISESEQLISVLKTCLRTPNQHLTTATLSLLPILFPLLILRQFNQPQPPTSLVSSSTSSLSQSSIIDASTLRQVLTAFLPAGGIFDRLGDAREKPREKARESLIVLGSLAFRSNSGSAISKKEGKGPETPLMIFERFLREGGLSSKVWRVREQAILTLVHIRRAHHLLPIRLYLPFLVDALEDTDAHVRDCSRQSIVELFTGLGVSDAARADLKKEMTKKGVRKTIVESVLSKLLAGTPTGEGSEAGDINGRPKEYVPPSLALQGRKPTMGSSATGLSRTASYGSVADASRPSSRSAGTSPTIPSSETAVSDLQPVYIASARDLETEFAGMAKPFEGKETEHNWAAREQAVQRVRGMIKGDVHVRYADTFLACLRGGFVKDSLRALVSLRTTVSANTCFLYTELSAALGSALDPLAEMLLTNLLRMAALTKKITAQQSQASVTAIITYASAQPRVVLPLLWNTLQEKPIQSRAFAVGHIKKYIEVHALQSKHAIDTSGGLDILEKVTKKSLGDPNPAVRESARVCFWVFESVWNERGVAILESLDATARKQLEKACPNPDRAAAVLPPSTPKTTKKSSVAAAIAASRAKAKAIATAPPTLRHQATSTSHAARATSPPLRRSISPVVFSKNAAASDSSTAKVRASFSPPVSPRSRIGSNNVPRSVSSSSLSQSRTSPGTSRSSSPSPTTVDQSSSRRRTSSPLVPATTSPSRNSVLRRAMQTALPASPPNSTSYYQLSPTPRTVVRSSNPRTSNPRSTTAVPVTYRQSATLSALNGEDESLLLATAIPIPEDSDSDPEDSINLISFSTPFEVYPPKPSTPAPRSPVPQSPVANSNSQALSSPVSNGSKIALSNTLSTGSPPGGPPAPIIEDALRARAEQAESAAERLLELVDPEEEGIQHSTIPSSLLVGSAHVTPKPKPPVSVTRIQAIPPTTPINRKTAILRQAALFKDSPAQNGSSGSLMGVLHDSKHETGWWLKRMTMIERGTPLKTLESSASVRSQELQSYIDTLEQGDASSRVLQKLALLCVENPVVEPLSPTSPFAIPASPSPFISNPRSVQALHADFWTQNKNFDRLLNALVIYLDPSQAEDRLEYGLIVLWEILENQAQYIEGREADIFSVLLAVRYCNKLNVLEATNTIRDALTTRGGAVYGLTTMHACLKAFQAGAIPSFSTVEVKASTYAFGLVALGKFILRLPPTILEEELPRLKATLIPAINDRSSLVVRESAAASIIAAQLVLRDERQLFALLDGLADEKKNLLTYLFDKHGAREQNASNGTSGMDKLEKEMRRLDTRTNASPRPSLSTT